MARLDPSLKHAITPPRLDANKIHRERLVDAIHGEISRKLIVIAAPAGYGKTTLLADFAAHTDIPVCWVGLTEADRDVMRLSTVLLASLEKRFRRLKNSLDLRAYANSPPEALAQAFVGMISQNIDEAFAILLDEADVLNSSEGGIAFLDSFLERTTDQVNVIAAGREVLEVSLARLMAEGALAGFGPHDLALDKDELADLANVAYDEELTDSEIFQVLDETKGWITGVIMSGVLGGRSLRAIGANSRPMVYEYLASVVLNRQPEDLRKFMLDSSVLPVMSVDACQSALNELDAQQHLERLVADGLFVTASGEDPPSYEYHPLFRKFLLETRRASDPESFLNLCSKVATYLEGYGEIEQAVQVYVMAGDLDRGRKVAESHADGLYDEGRTTTLGNWAELFGVAEHPNSRIRILVASSQIEGGRLQEAEELLAGLFHDDRIVASNDILSRAAIRLASVAYTKGNDADALGWISRAEEYNNENEFYDVAIDCLRFRSLIGMRSGQIDEALSLAEQAVSLLREGEEEYLSVLTLSTLMTVLVAAGKLQDARDAGLNAVEIVSSLGAPMPAARVLNNLATIEHANGRFEEALEHYAGSLEKAKLAGSEPFQAQVYLGQADLFNDIGLVRQSAELYAEAVDILTRANDLEWTVYVCVQTSILHRRNGGIQTAKDWLERAIELGKTQPDMPKIRIQVASLELLAKPANARRTLQRVLGDGRLTPADEVLAHYFLAKAELLSGSEDSARQELEDALQLANASQLFQDFAAEFMADREMRDFSRGQVGSSAAWGLVEARIETMQAMARFYAGDQGTQASVSTDVQLQALGRGTILVRGEEVQDLKPQVKEFLFFLADQGGAERERLAQTFWPDFGSGRQTANIHMAVYGLRNALGKDFIHLDGVAYSVSSDVDLAYDVREFERTARVAQELPVGDPRRLFAFTEAIRQYQGPFLLESESDWVVERRRYLEMLYLDLVSQHADEALMRDQPLRAVQLLQDALSVDPYRDDLNLRYILLLGRLNRRSEIVSHYQRYVSLLSSDLGLDPSEDVRDAYGRMIG